MRACLTAEGGKYTVRYSVANSPSLRHYLISGSYRPRMCELALASASGGTAPMAVVTRLRGRRIQPGIGTSASRQP